MLDKICNYIALMRLNRPVGIYLLLAPTLWSLWLAGDEQPSRTVFVVFVLGVILLRSAGCVINDDVDREFDAQVKRTRDRPLATGAVSVFEARLLAAILLLIAFTLVLIMNIATILMSLVALTFIISYPLMKRWHHLPQVYLGVTFGWAIPMAWVAQNNTFPVTAIWLLYAANICWTVAYDTIYALIDRDDDFEAGIKSTAILFGRYDRVFIGLFHTAGLTLLLFAGKLFGLGLWFYAGIAIAAVLALYQLWEIREREATACLSAFTNNAWLGLIVFLGIFLEKLPTVL